MAQPNNNYWPDFIPMAGRNVYLDGWETTLSADWNGEGWPPLVDWIGLDSILITVPAVIAKIVIEWVDSGNTYRRLYKLYKNSDGNRSRAISDMATCADSSSGVMPAGARVYIPMLASDMQIFENFGQLVLPYFLQNGLFENIFPIWPELIMPDGSYYQFPDASSNPLVTGLLISVFRLGSNYIVMSEVRLTLPGGWYVPPVFSQVSS